MRAAPDHASNQVDDDADGCMQRGRRELASGRVEAALDAFRQALRRDPKCIEALLEIARLLHADGQPRQAATCLARALELDDRAVRPVTEQALAMAETGHVVPAEALLRRVLERAPRESGAWYALGVAQEYDGRSAEARQSYLCALAETPGHGHALGAYLALSIDDAGPHIVARAETALRAADTPAPAAALVGYGLAKHYDRHGEFAEAAKSGRLANAARRRAAGLLDREALAARVGGIVEAYTADFFAERRRFGVDTDQPVFIVGLPRSGTTLVEQILSAHPMLHGAGELPELARLAVHHRPEPSDAPWRAALALDQRSSLTAAHAYLEALRRGAPERALRISDKSPLNFFHLAFAALLFRNARVIHCTRDVRDTALSIWMENFSPDQQWSTDFDDLAFFAGQYRRLMAHWGTALPLPTLDVAYEDTVADVEGQARRLLDFLGVPWDDRCLDFHNTGRAVQTPSRWQVRQPIYTRSVGRWRRYAEHLPELEGAFADLQP